MRSVEFVAVAQVAGPSAKLTIAHK